MPGPEEGHVNKVLASSASGATQLILVQLAAKLFTFAANQLILRSLSPTIMGIAAQLELFSITVLYFSRESIRTAIQRQPALFSAATVGKDGHLKSAHRKPCLAADARSEASQAVVNVSYLSLGLGILLSVAATVFYSHFAANEAGRVPLFRHSVALTGLASLVELGTEPFFAIVQQHMLYRKRAAVEMFASFIKSAAMCTAFVWASWAGYDVGVLPFALGYLGYAVTLLCGYSMASLKEESQSRYSFFLARIKSSDTSGYLAGTFSRRLVSLSANAFFQSSVKHLLSQSDAMMLASMTSLKDQGTYSLAANYGGLIARILFQPVEESSRNLFSALLSPNETDGPDVQSVKAAKSHLIDIMRGYGVLSVLILPIGPVLAPHMLHILGGHRWTSPEVDGLISLYCYYIPFLAFNGITEAFVSSTASPAELRRHAGWMGAFSVSFAIAAYMFLKIGGLGAQGLVLANIVNMFARLLWSYGFIKAYFGRRKTEFALSDVSLRLGTYAAAAMSAALMLAQPADFTTVFRGLLKAIAFGATYTLVVFYLEREYLAGLYRRTFHTLTLKGEQRKID